MKAIEAAKLADKADYSKLVLEQFIALIKKAATEGRYEVRFLPKNLESVDNGTKTQVKKSLEDLGYFVHYNEQEYVICWRGVK